MEDSPESMPFHSISQAVRKVYYGWWIVLASSVICMLGYGMGIYSFGIFFKPMMNEFGWSRAMTAGAFSMRNIEGGITSPLVGWAVDKYGPRPVIFIGAIILGAGFMLMFFVNSLLNLYLIYGIMISIGMSTTLYLPNMTALSHWFVRKISRALALLSVGAGVGGFICAPLAAMLIIHIGWRYSFVLIGLTIWVVGIPLSLLIRRRPEDMGLLPDGDPPIGLSNMEAVSISKEEAPADESGGDWTLKMALTSKVYWLLVSSFFLSGMAHSVVTVHAVPALTDFGISAESAAFALGFMVLISIVGRLSFGWLGDYIQKRYLFVGVYLFQAAGIFVLMNVGSMASVYLFTVLFGIGFGGGVPLRPALRAEYFGRSSFAKIGGFMSPITVIGSAFLTGPEPTTTSSPPWLCCKFWLQ
ncbi:MAG: MFS transporter [Deltaproteobacteria bacterium]|nr:MFS transporter [Deltaproteobacteria bacterium]